MMPGTEQMGQQPMQAGQDMGANAPDSGSPEEAQVRQQMAQIAQQLPPEMLQEIVRNPEQFLQAVVQQLMEEQGLDEGQATQIASIFLEEVMKLAQTSSNMTLGEIDPTAGESGLQQQGMGQPPQGGGGLYGGEPPVNF